MSALWDNDEDMTQLVEVALPDLIEAVSNPHRWDHDSLIERARLAIVDDYMGDVDSVDFDNEGDQKRLRQDSALAVEIVLQALMAVAYHLVYKADKGYKPCKGDAA